MIELGTAVEIFVIMLFASVLGSVSTLALYQAYKQDVKNRKQYDDGWAWGYYNGDWELFHVHGGEYCLYSLSHEVPEGRVILGPRLKIESAPKEKPYDQRY